MCDTNGYQTGVPRRPRGALNKVGSLGPHHFVLSQRKSTCGCWTGRLVEWSRVSPGVLQNHWRHSSCDWDWTKSYGTSWSVDSAGCSTTWKAALGRLTPASVESLSVDTTSAGRRENCSRNPARPDDHRNSRADCSSLTTSEAKLRAPLPKRVTIGRKLNCPTRESSHL